jgi:RNAse (barnase) inhibitor barstar
MSKFIFVETPQSYLCNNSFIVKMSEDVCNKDDIIRDFSEKLAFPSSFGNNWDALYDSLCDLHWINEERIIILYNYIPFLEKNEAKIILNIFNDVLNTWENDGTHRIDFVFPAKQKHEIENILQNE